MNTDHNQIHEQLIAPFPPGDLEWRVQSGGRSKSGKQWALIVPYITARAVMDRLDATVGTLNWCEDYRKGPGDASMICRLSVRFADEWISKEDVAPATGIEPEKGAFSDSLKRCAVKWGIGRYLYKLDTYWADIVSKGKLKGQFKDRDGKRHRFEYNPPSLPDFALPKPPTRPKPTDTDTGRAPVEKKPPLDSPGEDSFSGERGRSAVPPATSKAAAVADERIKWLRGNLAGNTGPAAVGKAVKAINSWVERDDKESPMPIGADAVKAGRAEFWKTVTRKRQTPGEHSWTKQTVIDFIFTLIECGDEEMGAEEAWKTLPASLLLPLQKFFELVPDVPFEKPAEQVTSATLADIKEAQRPGRNFIDAAKLPPKEIIGAEKWPRSPIGLTQPQAELLLEWMRT